MNHAVCVRPGADQSPLIVVHDHASGLEYLDELAGHMNGGAAIDALSPASVEEGPLTTLEGMAMRMTRVIREKQPVGPYRLAGVASGGLLAYEVATQLLGQDQQVGFLGLLATRHHENGVRVSGCHSALGEAAIRYRPHPITVPVYLFASDQVAVADRDLGWNAIVPDGLLRVITVPCEPSARAAGEDAQWLGRAIADAIRDAASDSATLPSTYSRLVPLQSRRHAVPAYMCIPGAGADVTSFVSIVSSLGDRWPVYGLQPRGLDGALVPHSTVQAAALTHVVAINETYPHGQLHLIGHSFGGWQAFEIACLLGETGRRVAAVTLLDSDCPDNDDGVSREYTDMDCLQEWLRGIEQQLGRSLGVAGAELDVRTGRQQRELLHRRLVRSGLLPPQSSPGVLQGRLRTFAAALRTHYCPRRLYGGPVTLVVVDDPDLDAAGNRQRAEDMVGGWRQWAPNLACIKAPGNHLTMLSPPHAGFLADVIRQSLV